MGDATSKLFQLRPVTFLYKPEYDKSHTLQYGLIAEKVARIYPELVAYDKDGRVLSVKYQLLAPMLLNEVQKQYHRAEAEATVIARPHAQIESLKLQLKQQNEDFELRLSRLEKATGVGTSVLASTTK